MAHNKGFKCEFIDSVFEGFYCMKCSLVARKLTLTSCCKESFCQTCIADTQEQGKPCPVCGKKKFSAIKHVRNQKRINALQVYCSMKERGCAWSGTLDQLDTHLDPHLDNCQYVDTKCPLNCLQTVPKNKVDQHVAQECSKRPHVCQHCGFKASYEEVVDTHLQKCKYVPLQCPNMCGVSCEQELMEYHMKICRLEEIKCEFSNVGCDGQFIRENQDKHTRQNSQKHLTLTASLAVETKKQLQQKLLEQDKKYKAEEEKLKQKIEEQDMKIGAQEKKLVEQEKKLREQEKQLGEQKKEIHELIQSQHKVIAKVSDLIALTGMNQKFEMKQFSMEIQSPSDHPNEWKSPPMYTHVYGYKFCIGVCAHMTKKKDHIGVDLLSMPGECDGHLTWPRKVKLKIEILNQQEGENICEERVYTILKKPVEPYKYIQWILVLSHSQLENYLANDTLYFYISNIELV